MKKILITGANGFIGSFLVEKALLLGYTVWAGVRKNSNREYLQDKQIQFLEFDWNNQSLLERQISDFGAINGRFDYVIHNAGITKCIDKNDFDKVNFTNTLILIHALINTGCSPDKFIYMSSLSVMGLGDEISYTPFRETDTPHPNTAYGHSKHRAEQYIISQSNIPYLIFRPTGVYGPREKDYLMMLKTVKSGLDISVGFMPQHLTFIYVKDLADAIFLGIESEIKNKIYLVADGDVYTEKEYTSLIKETIGKKHVISLKVPLFVLKLISILAEYFSKIIDKPSTLNKDKYKIMKQRNWECDTSPLAEDLDFYPQYNLRQGLEESVSWYKENGWL